MRARRNRFAVGATLALATTVVAALLLTAGPAKAKGFATLHVLEGTVDVRTAGAAAFHEADDGEALYQGDTVDAGAGRAEVAYFEGSVTRLDRQTVFTLEELASVGRGGKVITARQSGGKTFSRVVKLSGSESRFDVATPTATASVRGTGFVTRHLLDGTSLVWVLEGLVQVGHGGSQTPVSAGQGLAVASNGSTSGPYMLTSAELNDPWVLFNLCAQESSASPSCPGDTVLGETVVRPHPKVDEPTEESTAVTQGSAPANDEVTVKKKKPKKDDGDDAGDTPGGNTGGGSTGGGGTEPPPPPPPTTEVNPLQPVCDVLEEVGDQVGVDPPDPPCT